MKNKLEDLNNHLFAQLERLSNEELSESEIEAESARSKAIVEVADRVIDNANITLSAMKLAVSQGRVIPDNKLIGLENTDA
ncbi:MAG: hypothetical protein ACI9SP_001621 [Arenicella sp.]|jgi:hypothetical protein